MHDIARRLCCRVITYINFLKPFALFVFLQIYRSFLFVVVTNVCIGRVNAMFVNYWQSCMEQSCFDILLKFNTKYWFTFKLIFMLLWAVSQVFNYVSKDELLRILIGNHNKLDIGPECLYRSFEHPSTALSRNVVDWCCSHQSSRNTAF